jgi:hypothetical protein
MSSAGVSSSDQYRGRQSNTKKRRDSHIWTADPLGHYPETQWTSARLFDVESFGCDGALVYDPCCGWGRILHAAAVAGYTTLGSDIVDRRHDPKHGHRDFKFFKHDFLRKLPLLCSPFSIVSNPPFTGDSIERFVERALFIVKYKVAVLVPLRRLPAAHWLKGLPLETVYLLPPRPSLPPASYILAGNEPGGGGQDFAWLVFNLRNASIAAPRMKWLPRDGGQS